MNANILFFDSLVLARKTTAKHELILLNLAHVEGRPNSEIGGKKYDFGRTKTTAKQL